LLRRLIGDVFIPRAVYDEVVVNGQDQPGAREVDEATAQWIRIVDVADPGAVSEIRDRTGLQAGETETIVLAGQLGINTVLLDDQRAVVEALSRKFNIVRTPALYLAAKRAGLLPEVKSKLDALRSFGFHLRDAHYGIILSQAGEV
jgi:predicted nucleic acid-binding protein